VRHVFALSFAVLITTAAHVHAGMSARTWTIDGVERSGNVYTPDDASKKPESGWPVVFVFHGHANTAEGAQRQFGIERHWPRAIVVYLQGLPTPGLRVDQEGRKSGWTVRGGPKSNRDIKLYDEVLKRVLAGDGGDAKRVYVTGSSNGGLFAYCLWMHRGETIRAVAPVSASAGEVKTFDLAPKPAMLVAGRKDTLVDFREQEATMQHIKEVNGCTGEGKPWGGDTARRFASTKDAPTILWKHDGGHAPPKQIGRAVTAFFKEIDDDEDGKR
jgi:polyhydroxybutyrate depolymerase